MFANPDFEPSDEELLTLGGEPGEKIVPCVPDLHPQFVASPREWLQESGRRAAAKTERDE